MGINENTTTTTATSEMQTPDKLDMDASTKTAWEESSDFANYFCTYGFLYHQKQMLTDSLRMKSYQDSIMKNPDCFKDKVVLDVGTGSGILSMWAAQAGARKVYAVEATDMAHHARTVIAANNLDNVITVIQSKVEDVKLPEKVDIIISEWMGYFLLRESMLDSVLFARDTFLKEGGALYPSHCTMYVGAVRENSWNTSRMDECNSGMDDWAEFVEFTKATYGIDYSALNDAFRREQERYSLGTSMFETLDASQVLGEPSAFKTLDLLTCTLEDIKVVGSEFEISMTEVAPRIGGLVGWFDVDFYGSPANPTAESVTLTTSPYVEATHWGQQVFPFIPSIQTCAGDSIRGKVLVTRRRENQRLMNVKVDFEIIRASKESVKPSDAQQTIVFAIE